MTNIPVTVREGDYESFISRLYLFVIVGLLVGSLIGVAGLIFQWRLPVPMAAALTLLGIYVLTGINHIDGLSDTADGLITSGPRDKKIRSMKDVHAGAGGVLAIGLDLLFLYAMVSVFATSSLPLLFPLLAAEICAKAAMITVIAFGRSMGPGMGAVAMAAAKKSHYVAGLIVACVVIMAATLVTGTLATGIPAWRIWLAGFAALLSPLVVAGALMSAADRNFGGVNGDVMGAANEIGRVAALVVMGVVLWMRF